MSSLQRSLMKKHPPLPSTNKPPSVQGRRGAGRDYTPVSWRRYFAAAEDARVDSGDMFHVYRTGSSGPLLVLLHGGGFSALTWSLFTERIVRSVECQVLAIDLRGHGETVTEDETDLSLPRLISDVTAVVSVLFGAAVPPVLLVGHSMGGSLAVHLAHGWSLGPLVGLVVIDVVEGSAVDALTSMGTFLRSRPDRFRSIEHAIEWCVRSGTVRNLDSARVSMPGHIKNVVTGEPATRELERGRSSSEPADSVLPPPPAAADCIPEEQPADTTPTPAPAQDTGGGYTWRIDLSATERHWQDWFRGLSALFLSAPPPKVLLLAGVDRLDRELTVGQMQGKFQMQVLPRSGHAVHEDAPQSVADAISTFLVRNRLTKPLDGFQTMPPGC